MQLAKKQKHAKNVLSDAENLTHVFVAEGLRDLELRAF